MVVSLIPVRFFLNNKKLGKIVNFNLDILKMIPHGIKLISFQGDTDKLTSPVKTPIFQAHGDIDQVVSFQRGLATSQILQKLAKNYQFVPYQGMGHEGTMEELEDVKKFITKYLPEDYS